MYVLREEDNMEFLGKIEKVIAGWLRGVPHLPESARNWLGTNVWWIVLVGAILSAIAVVVGLVAVLGMVTLIGSVASTYYAATTFTAWALVTGLVGLAFSVFQVVLLAMAIKPLQLKQKKGWVILFATWLVGAVGVVVSSILSLNAISFVTGILFGAIWLAISGYFIFEIHSQFGQVEKSRGVKAEEAKTVAEK